MLWVCHISSSPGPHLLDRVPASPPKPSFSAAPHPSPPELKALGSPWYWTAQHTQGRWGARVGTAFTIASVRLLTGQGTTCRSHAVPRGRSCFHVVAGVHSAPANMGVLQFFQTPGSVFSTYMSRSGAAGSDGSSTSSVLGTSTLFSMVAAPFPFPATVQGGFPLPHTLSSTYCM